MNLADRVIRLEAEQTKTNQARVVPQQQQGKVFDSTNLHKEWAKACVAAGLGTLRPADKAGNRRYSGLIIHDLRRSALKNLMKAGVTEKVAMSISGHKTRAVFDRYHIVDEANVVNAMRRACRMCPSCQLEYS